MCKQKHEFIDLKVGDAYVGEFWVSGQPVTNNLSQSSYSLCALKLSSAGERFEWRSVVQT
jgi:hypothetical protein